MDGQKDVSKRILCDTEIAYILRGPRNNRACHGVMRVLSGEFRFMSFEFSLVKLRIFGYSLSACDIMKLAQWKLTFTAEVCLESGNKLSLNHAWVGTLKNSKTKKTVLRSDPEFNKWLKNRKKTYRDFNLLFPEHGAFRTFFPDISPFTFRECQGVFHAFYEEKKTLRLAAKIISDDLNGQIVMFESYDLFIYGYRVKKTVKIIPLIDSSEVINFELRQLSAFEKAQRAENTLELNHLNRSIDLGIHIAYIGERPAKAKNPGDDDPDLKKWLESKDYCEKSFLEIITNSDDSKVHAADELKLKAPSPEPDLVESEPKEKSTQPQKKPELPETIDWRSRIQNPGFKPNGEGYSKARDTASAILDRLMSCVSSDDPTFSSVLTTDDDFHMARFLAKTLVSSMMDFNARQEKKLNIKHFIAQNAKSSRPRSSNWKKTDDRPSSDVSRKRKFSEQDTYNHYPRFL